MTFSFKYREDLEIPEEELERLGFEPDEEPPFETGIIMNNDDADETLFDMNDHGLYLYPVWQIKLDESVGNHILEKLKILGVDIV